MTSEPCAHSVMTTSAERAGRAERIERQPAYVLHSRPYRETSALVDFFSRDYGRIRAVVKGGRGQRSRNRHLLQPFQLLELSWRGRGELKTLLSGELEGQTVSLQGRCLWCGLYLNELSLRLLPPQDPAPELFAYYQLALSHLADHEQQQAVLRIYEKRLLAQLGLALDFRQTHRGETLQANGCYHFDPQQGFERVAEDDGRGYPGEQLLAIERDDYSQAQVRLSAKRLMRQALAPLLGDRPLRSRELFQTSLSPVSKGAVR